MLVCRKIEQFKTGIPTLFYQSLGHSVRSFQYPTWEFEVLVPSHKQHVFLHDCTYLLLLHQKCNLWN
jgi:hypothetical protein